MQLSEIRIYPIKSLAGLPLTTATLTPKGLYLDRRWMLVDSQRQFLSQRSVPQMALLDLQWASRSPDVLRISHRKRNLEPLLLPLTPPVSNTSLQVGVWDDWVDAVVAGPAYDAWFTQALGVDCQLVFMPEAAQRSVDPNYAQAGDTLSFADGFPYLLANQASLQDLNQRLSQPVDMDRFRPNLLVAGAAPWEEDHWQSFQIGSVHFRSIKPCARCVLINVNPFTAEKSREPLDTLSSFRKKGNKVLFGINACWDQGAELQLKVGDSVVPVIDE